MRKHETAVCGTACTVVWEVGKCESRRQMPFMISIYLLPDFFRRLPFFVQSGTSFAVSSPFLSLGIAKNALTLGRTGTVKSL